MQVRGKAEKLRVSGVSVVNRMQYPKESERPARGKIEKLRVLGVSAVNRK